MTHHLIRRDTQIVCKFCDRLTNHGNRQGNKDWWHCDRCYVSFLINKKQNVYTYEFRTSLNDKQYIVNMYPEMPRTEICIWNNTQNHFSNEQVVKVFPSLLDLSPQNLQDKLKTILLFL